MSVESKSSFEELLEYWRKNSPPGIIRDQASQPIRSMADGKTYDSKSSYRRSLKEQGFMEVGDEKPTPPKIDFGTEQERVDDIKRALAVHE